MRRSLAFAITSSALAGCSLLYNPNNLPSAGGEAGIDAPPDAEIVNDADPRMLTIVDVTPSTIYEGQGDLGSPPAIVVISGHHIIDSNTIVEITPVSSSVQLALGTPVIAANGNWIAIPVTAHVDMSLLKGTSVALDVKVTETIPPAGGGGTSMSMLSGKLVLAGLNELVPGAGLDELSGVTINTDKIPPGTRYSKVDLSSIATLSFTGTARAIIHSMSGITTAAVNASGKPGTALQTPGIAGGCAGGAPRSVGGCDSGGAAGDNSSLLGNGGGGGGGGFAASGGDGSGTAHGGGGSRTGDELITTYDGFAALTPNRAGGGAGAGPSLILGVLGNGGGGGAGGDSIEFTAEGNVSVGSITANGGAGEASGSGGGGGGGAGGLVMVRAGGSLTTGGPISVRGGGGNTGNAGTANQGGTGADGRVRWDAQSATPPTVMGTVHRGPAFKLTAQVYRTPDVMIPLVGTANDRFNASAVNAGMTYLGEQGILINGDGTASYHQLLHQGLNHLCITIDGGRPGTSEADTCVDVAFLP